MAWRTITTHPTYEVSNAGEVRNVVTGKVLKNRFDKDGYHRVNLYDLHKNMTTGRVHRLVAQYHIANPDNKLYVDHVDRNKTNNAVSNLRWATQIENEANKDYWVRKTDGTHYITAKPSGSFEVNIQGRTKFRKNYKTIEEAIQARDAFIAEHPR